MSTILPTHRCFDDALDYIELRVTEDPSLCEAGSSLRLVHGVALATEDNVSLPEGEPYAHAWVEEGALVWSAGLLEGARIFFAVEREEFYREMRVQRSVVYTLLEVWIENRRSGHYGPWQEDLRALCRPKETP